MKNNAAETSFETNFTEITCKLWMRTVQIILSTAFKSRLLYFQDIVSSGFLHDYNFSYLDDFLVIKLEYWRYSGNCVFSFLFFFF